MGEAAIRASEAHAYRLYFLDDAGKIANVAELECADDEAAISAAAELKSQRARELWDRARVVRRFHADATQD